MKDNNTLTDVITDYLQRGRQPVRSYAAAVQTVMGMQANEVKRLLKALIDTSVELSQESATVCKLAAASLVQKEMKFRLNNESMTLIPFNIHDFTAAIEMGRKYADEYAPVLPDTDDENGDDTTKKRGRKGDTFDIVKSYFVDNPDAIDNDAKTVADTLSNESGINYNTALVYVYKCKKLHKQDQLL